MSKKSSPLSVGTKTKTKTANTEAAERTETATSNRANAATSGNTSPTTMQAVKIKKELPSDEIKEFAENTMNELLGWYGFDGVDRLDLSAKTSRLLQSAAAATAANVALSSSISNNNNNNNNPTGQRHSMEKRRSRSRAATLLQLQQQQQQNEHMRNILNNNNNSNSNSKANNKNNNRKMAVNCGDSGGNYRVGTRIGVTGVVGGGGSVGAGTLTGGESTTSDHDTRSSREDDSKSPISAGKAVVLEEKIDLQNCCWCRRPVPDNAPEFLTTTDGPRYCSESCFTQSRRASFKKAKTCDWCKHVRHAISYVDFQDGASQLQFCSDKCLNQYKMQIFCKETQAHLDMNPHLREQGLDAVASGNGAGLITPDLWLRNCRSRSASPASTLSVSPGPSGQAVILPNNAGSSSSPSSSAASNLGPSVAPHKPMISVAPVSKLMSKSSGILSSTPVSTNRSSPKHNRKKRPLRSSMNTPSDMSNTNSKGNHNALSRDISGLGAAVSTAASLMGKSKSLLGVSANNSSHSSSGGHLATVSGKVKPNASALSQFACSSVKDLHMSVPPLSPMLEQQTPPQSLPSQVVNSSGRGPARIPPVFFATPSGGQLSNNVPGGPIPHQQMSHGTFSQHSPQFLSNPGTPATAGLLPRFLGAGGYSGFPLPPHVVHAPPDMIGGLGLGALLGAPPPVTVMVPYPIVIPLPIPIPVPLPVMDFCKAYLPPHERVKLKEKEEREAKETFSLPTLTDEASLAPTESDCEQKIDVAEVTVNEEPLDFTKSKEFIDVLYKEQHGEVASTSARIVEEGASTIKYAASDEHLAATSSPATPTTTTTSVLTPSREDSSSPASPSKATHCIVHADESEALKRDMHTDDRNVPASGESDDAKQKLPKFKITRLQMKRTLIQTKEMPSGPNAAAAECSRPLRKRKRIIDCDFQNIALKEAATAEMDEGDELVMQNINTGANAATTTAATTTVTTVCNSNSKGFVKNRDNKVLI